MARDVYSQQTAAPMQVGRAHAAFLRLAYPGLTLIRAASISFISRQSWSVQLSVAQITPNEPTTFTNYSNLIDHFVFIK